MISFESDIENNILTAALAKYISITYAQAHKIIVSASKKDKQALLESIFAELKDHDIPIRELEYGDFTFEVVLDQGAYLELKRHRMMTQTPLPFTPQFGYSIPQIIQKAGLLDEYCQAMQIARDAYSTLHKISPAAASYVLPNAFNRCVILQSNFRSLFHMIALRTAPNAHFSMRRVGHQMADEIKAALPLLGSFLKYNPNETAQSIEDQYFFKV